MRRLSLITMAAAAALMLETTAHAQPATPPPLPEYGPTITLDQAMKAANAALAEAKKLNVIEGITIVNNAGGLV